MVDTARPTLTPMITDRPTEPSLRLLRLMHLVSPSLPTGAFSYSQGIESAVDMAWIRTAADLEHWLADQLHSSIARLDLPVLLRMYRAADAADGAGLEHVVRTRMFVTDIGPLPPVGGKFPKEIRHSVMHGAGWRTWCWPR